MAEVEAPDVTPPKETDLPQSSTPQLVTLDGSTPEVVPAEKVAAKKPRKPRPPKIVAKLTTSLGVPFGALGFLGFLAATFSAGATSGVEPFNVTSCGVELWGRSASFAGVMSNVIGCGVELWGRSGDSGLSVDIQP